MRHIDEDTITQAVIAGHAAAGDARLRELMTSLVQHLHAFAREARLSEAEWAAGLRFIAECVRDGDAQPLAQLSDVLGLSTLVAALGRRRSFAGQPGTERTLPLAWHADRAPHAAHAALAVDPLPGPAESCFVRGQVRSVDGRTLAGAELHVWPSGMSGEHAAGAACRSGADGSFLLRCALAREQPIIDDGPVGRMLHALGRHHWRPAHLQFMISAAGHEPLHTQVFRAGERYLHSDAAFGVRRALVAEWLRHEGGRAPDGRYSVAPFHTLDFDFVLTPTTGDRP